MRALELSLRNYRVFEEVDLELPSRVIGIFGANGSGKSTLVEAIGVALYGLDFARTPKQQIRTHGLLTDCQIRLVFEHAGTQYEVRREIKGKNHAAEAELYTRRSAAEGSTLAMGVTEVDAEIRRLLRMDRQVFRASVFAEQKQLDAFSDLTKARRKEMVLRLLGIKPVDDARTAARAEARDLKRDADSLAGSLPDLPSLEAELAAAAESAAAAEAASTAAREALGKANARAQAADTAFTESDRVRAESERVTALRASTAGELERLARRAAELESRLAAAKERLAGLGELQSERQALGDAADRLRLARELVKEAVELQKTEAALDALSAVDGASALEELEGARAAATEGAEAAARAEVEAERASHQLEEARSTLDAAGELDPSQPCPTCGQPLGEGFGGYVAHCRDETARLKAALAAAEKTLAASLKARAAADARLVKSAKAAETVQAALARRTDLQARAEELRAEVNALSAPFGDAAPDVKALEAEAARARELDEALAGLQAEARALETLESDLAAAAEESDACRVRLEDYDRESAGLAFDAEEHARVGKERDEARTLLITAREADREAASRAKEVSAARAQLQGRLEQARQTAELVGSKREDARYLERVTVLLDGFRDHLVARIGPELSREAEALFRELTNHEYEDLKIAEDDLAIQIADQGTYFDIARFSGSETDLANLALRVAISVHLSRMAGADVGMMILDEVLGSLDAERRDLMVQAMSRLADRFHQLFVITHAEPVKDAFPASIQIRKTGRRRSEAVLV